MLESPLIQYKVGDVVNLELSLLHLQSIGFFENSTSFITYNKYELKVQYYHIEEFKSKDSEQKKFIENYSTIIEFIKTLKAISKYNYEELDLVNVFISIEDKSVVMQLDYDANLVKKLTDNSVLNLKDVIDTFEKDKSEKKAIFINELIDFLNLMLEVDRFSNLLSYFSNYYSKSINAFQFYLRDYSFNKLKVELDSKALEFTQKIQGVINDSQVKLIAIPTAFVLSISTFEFDNPMSVKNLGALIGLLIFSVLIQIFLNNQRSTLHFIKKNIDSYKQTFKGDNLKQVVDSFSLVDQEFYKQDLRLRYVEVILWSIPLGLFSLVVYLSFAFNSIVFIYLSIIMLHAYFRVNWNIDKT
jgi:hypothetical protein